LPAFKRVERDLDRHDDFHGHEGALPLRRHPPSEWVAWQAAFVEAARAVGYPACDDSNAPGSHGVGAHAMNKLDNRRISVAEAYLTPEVRARAALGLQAHTLARRVLVQNGRVTGVEVERRGAVETLRAKTVVLCAGAINTPALLLRSGIGPADELARLSCTLVAELPAIGQRLLDHPGFALFLRPRWGAPTSRHDPLIQTVLRYPSGARNHPSDMMMQPGSKVNLPRIDLPLVSVMAQVGKPRGSGRIVFPSTDPRVRPIVDSQLLAHPDDRTLAVDAMRRAYAIAQQPTMRALAAHVWPSESVLRDPARIEQWVVRALDSGYHPCGTVPMGPDGSPAAACDSRGRMRGVAGLVVADASLMPTIPSANIHLATLMIGERIGAWLAAEAR
jgi:choline dehydrogenase